jgi:hypothetical protein
MNNTMKKDLILITCFVPDARRQQMLRELVYGINKNNFDIMVSSHTIIPDDIFNKVDYFIYEKDNAIDFNVSNKFYFYFYSEQFSIKTTEPKKYNHFVPVIRHIISGLIYAKNLGYTKVHYFEFDSLIKNDTELIDNSNLLENHSAIFYRLPHLSYPNSPISFNLNKISPKWFELKDENFESFLRSENSNKIVEQYEWELLSECDDFYQKEYEVLEKNGINVALNYDLDDNKWIIPVFKESDNNLYIFSWVENEEDVNSEVIVIVNNESVFKLKRPFKGFWMVSPIGHIDSVKSITILVNGVITREYDFNKTNINEFIRHNFIY